MTFMQPPDDAEQRLVRLLALKRHELPPPGFFDQLPVRILVNLRAGSEVDDAPWWRRAWRAFAHEPMVGLSYASLGVGAVLFGVSVLETAIDVQAPPVGPSQGFFPAVSHDLVLTPPQPQQSGLIYRVADPVSSPWFENPSYSLATTGILISAGPANRFGNAEVIPVAYPSPGR